MTPTERLRARVVTLVLWGQLSLAAGLYLLVGVLLWFRGNDAVPDALWLAAGAASTAIYSFLSNSKGTDGQEPAGTPADPVSVTAAGSGPMRLDDAA